MNSLRTVDAGGFRIAYRAAGAGARAVVAVHCSGSSPSQWRALLDAVARSDPDLHLYAPALSGYAGTRRLDGGAPRAHDDASVLAHFIDATGAGAGVDLIGHSYGGATALVVALARPGAVRSLTLIEPVLFGLLNEAGRIAEGRRVEAFARAQIALVDAGGAAAAARSFVTHWSGAAAWRGLPGHRRAVLVDAMPKIADEWRLILDAPRRLAQIERLPMPVRLVAGDHTTAAMDALMQVLQAALPHASMHRIADAGHMAPVTHADSVNAVVLQQLRGQSRVAMGSARVGSRSPTPGKSGRSAACAGSMTPTRCWPSSAPAVCRGRVS